MVEEKSYGVQEGYIDVQGGYMLNNELSVLEATLAQLNSSWVELELELELG